ncbi:uncharacterized protein LOC142575050 [Dermacentor variabilis]|uniref:uncharacterized protein LOC142575050 n=1 Tax=Dermacentor variabilis TaxID=34621 RepID=UPI003F5C83E0
MTKLAANSPKWFLANASSCGHCGGPGLDEICCPAAAATATYLEQRFCLFTLPAPYICCVYRDLACLCLVEDKWTQVLVAVGLFGLLSLSVLKPYFARDSLPTMSRDGASPPGGPVTEG